MHEISFSLLLLAHVSLSLDNGLARTPPMGFLGWERFRCDVNCTEDPKNCISEQFYLEQADMLIKLGLKDLGYNHVNIDDCWDTKERNSEGRLQPDPKRFPHGMKYLATKMHSMGLKLGIYADYGTETCQGYPGSVGHLEIDAQTFAEWEVDMLKMDGCHSNRSTLDKGYPEMSRLLNKTGRPIIFSCSWPDYERHHKNPNYTLIAEYCNMWRNYLDVQDSWDSVLGIINYYGDNQDYFQPVAGPGNWNDPDMIIAGDFGLSLDQAKSQFAVWAIFAAPLFLSVDLRNMREDMFEIVSNNEIIEVDQDPLGVMGRRVVVNGILQVFSRPLVNGTYAVVFLNVNNGGGPSQMCASLKQMNVSASSVNARDLYEKKDVGTFTNDICVMVNPNGVVMLKLVPIATS